MKTIPLAAGTILGPYEILASLGAGGMGEVYKARDTRLGRLVALKVLLGGTVASVESKRRFFQEARAASALNHPNIVTIYDNGNDKGVDYLAMELVEGKVLDRLIPRNGMRMNEILAYGAQIADALAKAHAAAIVHRDLKPANVMVTPEGVAKVLDFGIAKLIRLSEQTESEETRTSRRDGRGDPSRNHCLYVSRASRSQTRGRPFGHLLAWSHALRNGFRAETVSRRESHVHTCGGHTGGPNAGDSNPAGCARRIRADRQPLHAQRSRAPLPARRRS